MNMKYFMYFAHKEIYLIFLEKKNLLIYILKAEIVNDGRKGAERTNSKVREAFPAEQWFQDAHRFP